VSWVEEVVTALSGLEGRVFVGLSGGADSAVLAYCAVGARLEPTLVYVHHGLPGSDAMESAANAVAEWLERPLTVLRTEMTGRSETEAREARHEAFSSLADGTLLLGHTQSDQAETVVMHLMRGSGPRGLSGIPSERGAIRRPLLGITRQRVREAATGLRIPFADDPENVVSTHLRNWVRLSVIPLLEERVPSTVPLLARTAVLMADVAPVPVESSGTEAVRMPLAWLRTVNAATLSESLREAVRRVRPPYPASFDEVRRMLAVVDGSTPRAELEGGLLVLRDRASCWIGSAPVCPDPAPMEDGLRWGSWSFSVAALKLGSSLSSRIPLGAVVRGAQSQDRISMGEGTKDVWQALAEAGVPKEVRSAWPVVEVAGQVVWVPGVRGAPRTQVSDPDYLDFDAREENR
jgi:tRNA(Ile)-lysidine synthetase-like protein